MFRALPATVSSLEEISGTRSWQKDLSGLVGLVHHQSYTFSSFAEIHFHSQHNKYTYLQIEKKGEKEKITFIIQPERGGARKRAKGLCGIIAINYESVNRYNHEPITLNPQSLLVNHDRLELGTRFYNVPVFST